MKKFTVEMTYNDETEIHFTVEIDGTDNQIYGQLMMITRGTLMASGAQRATAYNEEGFDVCNYIK